MMSIYVAGSLAFDRIMSFNGAFADHILADKLHILNVSFLIDGLRKAAYPRHGGQEFFRIRRVPRIEGDFS